ncbi:Leucine permease transcriptional regulator [Handroanthus impetiginosus]|uniref:Leucine permease transcriptional regulator n=1 Tax=Handroanthus impetiginosus TaxID=429701 RepID=A0A2G9GEN4_9LAMI|nr:Leucine permease transcriptional regulator [Handroanthus impetiginosus]
MWHGGQYATYSSHQYPNYSPDSNSAYSSTTAIAASQYQQHYKQWEDYYNQTQTEVSCAPGTENISVSIASSVNSSVPTASASNNQMPAAYTPSWRPESSSSNLTSVQPIAVSGGAPEGYWKHGASAFQNDLPNSVQSHVQKPQEVNPVYESFQNQQNSTVSQGSNAPYPASYQISQSLQSSFQTVSQLPETLDSRKAGKLQIHTNPRIASNLPLSLPPKTDKDMSVTSAAAKPAYIAVPMQRSNEKVMSHEESDSMLKPGMFPKSLRGYVERALARCKNDKQKIACQAILKELITKATTDGTLHTRNWDTEPLFPMPNTDLVDKDNTHSLAPTSAVPKNKSPSRRVKSRWEPIPEEKVVDKAVTYGTAKYGGWNNKQFSGGKTENKGYLGAKFSLSDQRSFNKNVGRPAKRQRLGEDLNAADDVETSSDSDKEQSLTKYYSAAIAFADSPEEKKRRENRSKRFDKGHGNRTEKNLKGKDVGAGNSYARRATALVLSKTFEESGSRAVEDIDWDALTVKGTCQEVEKRYLRLTSAPDPSTVRPEEVLEKALLMVQNSQKNYLYKCDQLKSIRQDLTVQHIRNEFTVKVYETHARLAIEVGDLPEYNQCQSQLKTLYAEGITGCHMEFAAYNLLCDILHSKNNRDLLSAMSRLSADAKRDQAVKHALSVRSAVTSGNYVMFFRLYKTAPNLNTLLMDLYVEKMRYAAVKCMSRSYRPTVPVTYLSQILGFTNALPTNEASDEKEVDGVDECIEWLKAHGACLISDSSGETLLDTKASVSSLYMPEPEDAVSHGDASLAVNDFLTRSLS